MSKLSNVTQNPVFGQEHLVGNGLPSSYGSGKPTHTWVEVDRGTSVDGAGSTLTIHDIHYEVDVKTKPCCGQTVKKEILKGISGLFRPGMNAILGPTGSGKSSLLDVLAGRKDPRGLSGNLLIDGNPLPENFKCMVGYVVQDDVVMGTLTVRENFEFSAALRLPSHVSAKERKERVNQVVEELGLGHCANTKVGNEFFRGVSGGERKRTNIGMELIISPPVLFLDEPTTGLDANTANSVMLVLKRLAMKGRTIIFSIHQPRFTIYRLFDSMMLLSLGEAVYHGPADQTLQFFESVGYPCQEHNNPPDFFLDVVNGDLTAASGTVAEVIQKSENVNQVSPNDDKEPSDVHKKLVTAYQKSTWHKQIMCEVTPILSEHLDRVKKGTVVRIKAVEYATSFLHQLWILSIRTFRNLIRNPAVSILQPLILYRNPFYGFQRGSCITQVLVMLIFGAIVGAIYWQIDDTCKNGLQNRVGALFFIVMNQVFGNLSATELFIKERAIFLHENTSGFYRVSSYFLSKIICDMIPMRLIPVAVFSAVTYFMLGLEVDAGKFFIYFLALFFCTMGASSFAFFFSALVRIFAIANLLIAMAFVFMMVFGGLLVNLDSVQDWLEWIKWLSIFRYTLNALYVSELEGMTFRNVTGVSACPSGNDYLKQNNVDFGTSWDLWKNFVALGAITTIMMTFAYLRLRFMNKLR